MFADHFIITCPKDKDAYKSIYKAMLQHVGGDTDKVIQPHKVGREYREMYVHNIVDTRAEDKVQKELILELVKEFGVKKEHVSRPQKRQTKFKKVTLSAVVQQASSSAAAAAAVPAIEVVEKEAAVAEPEKCKHGCPADECSWCTDLGH